MKILGGLERTWLFICGVLLCLYAGDLIYRSVSSRSEMQEIRKTEKTLKFGEAVDTDPAGAGNPDFQLWPEKRVEADKDIHEGDVVELVTHEARVRYQVEETLIVEPEDVFVLQAKSSSTLTLVTRFPFDFEGSAAKRFIVRGSIESSSIG